MVKILKHPLSHIKLVGFILLLVYAVGFFLSYNATIQSLVLRWNRLDEAYGHGYLVLLIVAFLLFECKDKLSTLKAEPFLYASLPLLFLSLLWFVAFYLDIIIVQQLVLPLILLSLIALIAGRKTFLVLLFPISYIYFAIPIWDYLNNSLLEITACVVHYLVSIVNITVFIEGDTILLPHGAMVIAHGCSGLRYFIICSALSFLSAYQIFYTIKQRILVVALGMAIGIIINWIRVYSLVLIGYFTEMQSSLIADHEFFGWVLFIILYSPMFILGAVIKHEPVTLKETEDQGEVKQNRNTIILACLLAVVFGFSGPVLMYLMPKVQTFKYTQEINMKLELPNWKIVDGIDKNNYFFRSKAKKPAQTIVSEYSNGVSRVRLSLAAYDYQEESNDFLPYRVGHYDPNVWQSISSVSREFDSNEKKISVQSIELRHKRSNQTKMIWYWYIIGGTATSNVHLAKLLEFPATIYRRYDSAYVQLSISCGISCEQQIEDISDVIPLAFESTLEAMNNK